MKRDVVLTFKVTEDEAREMRRRAGDLSLSEYLRSKALGFSPGNPAKAVPADEVRGILNPKSDAVETLAKQIHNAEGHTMMVARRLAGERLQDDTAPGTAALASLGLLKGTDVA